MSQEHSFTHIHAVLHVYVHARARIGCCGESDGDSDLRGGLRLAAARDARMAAQELGEEASMQRRRRKFMHGISDTTPRLAASSMIACSGDDSD
jgi:hypothetical protein